MTLMNKKIKWVAKWEELDKTIASSDSRTGLITNLQHFLMDNKDKLVGKQITIKIIDLEW